MIAGNGTIEAKRMNRTAYVAILALGILFLVLAFKLFPDVIKVQIYYPEERNPHIYLLQENVEERERLEYEKFYSDEIVLPFREPELHDFYYIQVKLEMEEGMEAALPEIEIALGNYCMYQGNVFDPSQFLCHNVQLDQETNKLQIIGGDPFFLIQNPLGVLQASRRQIAVKYALTWTVVYLFCVLLCLKNKKILYHCAEKLYGWFAREWKQLLLLPAILLLSIVAGKILQWGNENWFHWKELQGCEAMVLSVAIGILFWLLQRRIQNKTCAVIAAVLIGIGLLFAIKGTTTFLTADERFSMKEQAKLDQDILRHWDMDQSRMNYMLMGTFWHWFPYEWLEEVLGLNYKPIGKLAHWLLGVLLLFYACDLVQRYLMNRDKKASDEQIAANYCILILLTVLLPVMTIGLKSYNYDLLSGCFGVLGGICALIAFRERSRSFGVKAVLFSSFAILEKMQTAPILLISIVVLAAVAVMEENGNRLQKAFAGLKYSVLAVAIHAVDTYLNQFYVVEILKDGNSPIHTFQDALNTAMTRIPLIPQIAAKLVSRPYVTELLSCALLAVLLAVIAAVFAKICIWYENKGEDIKLLSVRAVSLLLAVYLVWGIILILLRVDYRDDVFGYLLFIIRTYVMQIPTLLLVFSLILLICHKRLTGQVSLLWSCVIATWAITPAYLLEIRWNVTWMRYLNVFLCIYSLLVVAMVLPILYQMITKRNLVISAACASALFHIAETAGSMPGFTYFAPCWYRLTTIGLAEEKREMVVYWGENRASLGLKILDYCAENGLQDEPITIYYGNIRGLWMTQPENVTVAPDDWNLDYSGCSVTDHDFYALDTHAIALGMVKDGWPEGVEPIMTVTYRGYVLARIYQGSQLTEYFGK